MSISRLFENIRKWQGQHKVLAYLFNWALSLIFLAGCGILIKYGADDDRYFWIGVSIAIIAFLAMLPTILPHE